MSAIVQSPTNSSVGRSAPEPAANTIPQTRTVQSPQMPEHNPAPQQIGPPVSVQTAEPPTIAEQHAAEPETIPDDARSLLLERAKNNEATQTISAQQSPENAPAPEPEPIEPAMEALPETGAEAGTSAPDIVTQFINGQAALDAFSGHTTPPGDAHRQFTEELANRLTMQAKEKINE